MNITHILWSGLLVSIAWFILGGALYVNPVVAKIYKSFGEHPGMKKWPNQKKYMLYMYLGGALVPGIIFAAVYAFLAPVLGGSLGLNTLYFGLILVFVRILPRFFDMWIQSSYPNKLLVIEIVNGAILSFVAAGVLAWVA